MREPTDFLPSDGVRGIDVSHYQGNVDWRRVAASGIQFSYVKSSEGLNVPDKNFAANYGGSLDAGLLTGAYHFFLPNYDPARQAASFLKNVPRLATGALLPCVDVEATGGQSPAAIVAAVQIWLDTVAQKLGVAPMIYTGAWFWNPHMAGSTQFNHYFSWISDYRGSAKPDVPVGLDLWAFWQFTSKGQVPGVTGPCDLNRFRTTIDELKAMAA